MKRSYNDDDGRTIADMSGVDRHSVLSGSLTGLITSRRKNERMTRFETEQASEGNHPSDFPGLKKHFRESAEEKKQRRTYTLGAMSAGLLIGFIYLAAFGIVILLLLLLWHAF